MVPSYSKSYYYVECRDNVFKGHINDENSKAAFGMNLGFEYKIYVKFGCMGVPSNIRNY